MGMPTTGLYSHKRYQCTGCKTIEVIGTNHWGECYPYCEKCRSTTVWKCLEPLPKGMAKPAPWKMVKLGDVAKVTTPAKKGGRRGGAKK